MGIITKAIGILLIVLFLNLVAWISAKLLKQDIYESKVDMLIGVIAYLILYNLMDT